MSKELLQKAPDAQVSALMERAEDEKVFLESALRTALAQSVKPSKYPELSSENVLDLVKEAGLDWHTGFDLNDENRYAELVSLAFSLGSNLATHELAQADVQPALPLQVGHEAVYQVFANCHTIDDGWKDASEHAYWCFPEGKRRIIYTALLVQPDVQPAVPVAQAELLSDDVSYGYENIIGGERWVAYYADTELEAREDFLKFNADHVNNAGGEVYRLTRELVNMKDIQAKGGAA